MVVCAGRRNLGILIGRNWNKLMKLKFYFEGPPSQVDKLTEIMTLMAGPI